MLEVERGKEGKMKKMTERIKKAVGVASALHAGQIRKGDGVTPYIAHPISVATLLSACTNDEDVVIAGLLHDTIEDTGYKVDAMRAGFGDRVACIVLQVTEKDKKASWDERKRAYIDAIKDKSLEACLVACADKISNIRDLLKALERGGEKTWENFKAPKEKKLWYFRRVCEELEKRLQDPLVHDLRQALYELEGRKETDEQYN